MPERILTIVFVAACSLTVTAQAPERSVESNVIISERDPKVRIELPKSGRYVGADAQKNVQRLYWVQFEGYLPIKPDLHHQYDSPRHATIGGLDFYVDTWIREKNKKTTSGSDLEHIERLIRAKGYKMPAGMTIVRLVHLLDEQKRAPPGLSRVPVHQFRAAFSKKTGSPPRVLPGRFRTSGDFADPIVVCCGSLNALD